MTIYCQNVYLVASVNYPKNLRGHFTMPEQHFLRRFTYIPTPKNPYPPPPPPYIGGWVGVCVWFDVRVCEICVLSDDFLQG